MPGGGPDAVDQTNSRTQEGKVITVLLRLWHQAKAGTTINAFIVYVKTDMLWHLQGTPEGRGGIDRGCAKEPLSASSFSVESGNATPGADISRSQIDVLAYAGEDGGNSWEPLEPSRPE